ncbi:MAG: hypothetical protein ABL921_19205 [Pirellula sp.]
MLMDGKGRLEENQKNLERFQFVILHHQMPTLSERSSHWDLMFEANAPHGTTLITFETPPSFELWKTGAEVRRLPDHRPHYLTYQGPLSQDRGKVERIAAGALQWGILSDSIVLANVQSQYLAKDITKGMELNEIDKLAGSIRIDRSPSRDNSDEHFWRLVYTPTE